MTAEPPDRPDPDRPDAVSDNRSGSSTGVGGARFDERLTTPWWWYPFGVLIAAILAAEFRLADHSLTVWIPFAVCLPGAVIIVWSMGRQRNLVADGELLVRQAHVPLDVISSAISLEAGTLRRLVGRHGDPQAFVAVRGWVGPGVQLILDDADDPTPYWVVSTRRPDQLVAAIRAGQRALG